MLQLWLVSPTLTNVLATAQECHAADTGHDTPSRQSIKIQGRTVVVLSIGLERHTGIHNYPFYCLGSDPIGKSFHTPANAQLYDAVMVVDSQNLGRKYTYPPGLDPGPLVCEPITLSARPQLLLFTQNRWHELDAT